MDTPGHVDFSYEVSRSLAACEGSLLVVDSTQGVEAQTLANVYQAMDNNHELVIVLNKVDLPASEPEKVKQEIRGCYWPRYFQCNFSIRKIWNWNRRNFNSYC